MRSKQIVCGLVVVALMGGVSSRAMAQVFPWGAFDSVIEEVQDRGTLRVGLGLFEPWAACNADGELIGFWVDIGRKVAEDMGVEVEFARTNWTYIIPALIAEEFDIISGMQILPARNLKVNFTAPYNHIGIYLVANTAQNRQPGNTSRFQQSQCPRSRPGEAPRQSLRSRIHFPMPCSCCLIPTMRSSRPSSPVRRMRRRHSRRRGDTWVDAHPETLHLPFDEPFASGVMGFGVRKGDLDTLNFLNSWIATRQANGWLAQRRQYWFETREWADLVATDPDTGAACDESFQ